MPVSFTDAPRPWLRSRNSTALQSPKGASAGGFAAKVCQFELIAYLLNGCGLRFDLLL
jgi:hypothetical protein